MIQAANYQLLMELSADINTQVKASPAFAAFHRQHIINFYKHNKKSLEHAQNTFQDYKKIFLDEAQLEEEVKKFLASPVDIYL